MSEGMTLDALKCKTYVGGYVFPLYYIQSFISTMLHCKM